jgi:two-component system chemotaxis response regulator CheY
MEQRGPNAFPTGLRGLVADDHDLMRKSVAKTLRRLGFSEIIECANGKDAKAAIELGGIDLLVVDIELNFLSGFEVLDFVRSMETGSDIPFIVVSGASDKDDIVKAANKGAEDYIVKPFQSEELEAKIIKALNQYHAPGPVLARIRAAERAIQAEQWDVASQLITEALQLKDSPRARHLEAFILMKQKRMREALSKLQENIEVYPSYLKNYVSLANFYLAENDTDQAIRALSQELDFNPKQPLRQIKLANLLLKAKNPTRAIEHYRMALLETGKNPEALYGMGTAYAMCKKMEKSIYYFKRYRRNHPRDIRPLKAIVQFCEKADQHRLAEITLIDERKLHPDRLDVYNVLAEFYLRQDKVEDAVASLEAAIKRKPDYGPAYAILAKIAMKDGKVDDAVAVYRRFIDNGKDPTAYAYLAQLYLQTGKYSLGISTLHQGLQAKADPAKILPLLFVGMVKTKQYAKATLLAQRLKQMKLPQTITQSADDLELQVKARRRSNSSMKQVS